MVTILILEVNWVVKNLVKAILKRGFAMYIIMPQNIQNVVNLNGVRLNFTTAVSYMKYNIAGLTKKKLRCH